MQKFTWNPSSLIREVQVRGNVHVGEEALLFPSTDAKGGSLLTLPDMLRKQGFEVAPHHSGGKPALRIRGYGDVENLLGAIERSGLVEPSARAMTSFAEHIASKRGSSEHHR